VDAGFPIESCQAEGMIGKSGHRFSDWIMAEQQSMIRKNGGRFSGRIMQTAGEAMFRRVGS
jgi:hypothetical protein